MIDIKEPDWKLFRILHGVALERYCERVIEEVKSVADESSDSYHDTYLGIFLLLRERDKTLAGIFDDPRPSNALVLLASIIEEDLLNEEEISQFGPEALEAVESIMRIRRR
ncbi:MAG TPA: hypothetical protein VKB46_00105 [Pyrinomonadaceae bacterium]|nr:hypothetical protein [Pyrinomonadaceae bacterium]